MYALATSAGSRLAGAFIHNVQVLLSSPASGASNTSATVQLQAKILDPLRRSGAARFQLDRTALFASAELQTSSNVTVKGWADTPASWTSTAIGNGAWRYRAQAASVAVGAGPGVTGRYSSSTGFLQAGGAGIARSLYLYENKGVQSRVAGQGSSARALYLYENKGVRNHLDKPYARGLYLFVNRGYACVVARRALYLYLATRDGEVFPWLMKISPTEQYRGGQVDLYGDGFGEVLEAAGGATITTSTVSGANIGGNTVDLAAAEWVSTDTTTDAWIRFTFGAPKIITSIALEARTAGPAWGAPVLRFDAGGDVVGTSLPLLDASLSTSEYPVGGGRVLYALPAPRTTSWVEIRSTNNGADKAGRGLREVWILEDLDSAAETSTVALGIDGMGIVVWSNRSPGLHPANGGQPVTAAATVTVPATAESGLVVVTEST